MEPCAEVSALGVAKSVPGPGVAGASNFHRRLYEQSLAWRKAAVVGAQHGPAA